MPRSKREEIKENRVPFKKWAGPNCINRWEFYDSTKKISFCRKWKFNYFWSNEAVKIIARSYIFNYTKLFLIYLIDYRYERGWRCHTNCIKGAWSNS